MSMRTIPFRWEAEHLYAALCKSPRYSERGWIVLPQVRDATGAGAARSADAIAMNAWPSRGLEVHGFEIKIARYDWLRELKKPEKAEAFVRYCDRWWIVVPGTGEIQAGARSDPNFDVVQAGELPPTWGLIHVSADGKTKIIKEAPKLKPKPLDRLFLAAVLRSLEANATPAAAIEAARIEGMKKGIEEGEKHARRRLEFGSKRDEITWKRQSLESIRRYAEGLVKECRKAGDDCDLELAGIDSLADELQRMRQALETIAGLDPTEARIQAHAIALEALRAESVAPAAAVEVSSGLP